MKREYELMEICVWWSFKTQRSNGMNIFGFSCLNLPHFVTIVDIGTYCKHMPFLLLLINAN